MEEMYVNICKVLNDHAFLMVRSENRDVIVRRWDTEPQVRADRFFVLFRSSSLYTFTPAKSTNREGEEGGGGRPYTPANGLQI